MTPTEKQMRTFPSLWQIVKTLRAPGGCPWDRVQTHQSLRHFLLEESSEAIEALDEADNAKLSEELGDVLFQVLIHAAIAEEQREFKLGDVIEGITAKLVRRHPHVFGDADATTPDAVIEQWEDLKRKERNGGSALTGVPATLPALSQAQSIQRRAGKAGFQWDSAEQAWAAFQEEIDELKAATTHEERSDEAGDALFALANLIRYLDVDAEEALRDTCRGFSHLFREVESMANEKSLDLKETDIETKVAMWEEAKKRRPAQRRLKEDPMTQTQQSVVTRERFDSGMDWKSYMAHIQRNIPKFEFNYNETAVPGDKAAALKALAEKDNGPKRVLILGEDWCPDVFRGVPVFARMAEAAGWDLRIFPRDDNLDIMGEFLNKGEHQSIPTVVFYTGDHQYITHWIERPQKAEEEQGQYRGLFEGLDREKDHQEMRRRNDEFQTGPTWGSWRDATIDEVTALLEAKCA